MSKLRGAKNRVITVGLLWHSLQSDNFGVGALTQSQIAICKDAAKSAGIELKFYVFGTRGGSRYGANDPAITIGSRISVKEMLTGRSAFLKEIDKCDVVLDIGEGDSFTDIYGIRRYIFMILTKVAVLLKRIPLILSPQTIGPFDRWYTRWIATKVMNRCNQVLARDFLSTQYLKQCGVSDKVTGEVIDVAFRLPFKRPANSSNGKVRIGINISGLLFSGGYEGENQFGLSLDYPALMRSVLKTLTADSNNEIWLVPHVIPNDMPRDDDRIASRQLMKEFPSAKMAPEFGSPSEAKSFISGMDFVTGARMHACIAAFSSGVPVVPIAYSRKFNGLFSTLGYEWVADAKAMDNQAAENMILNGFKKRDELAVGIGKGNLIASRLLDDYTKNISRVFISVLSD